MVLVFFCFRRGSTYKIPLGKSPILFLQAGSFARHVSDLPAWSVLSRKGRVDASRCPFRLRAVLWPSGGHTAGAIIHLKTTTITFIKRMNMFSFPVLFSKLSPAHPVLFECEKCIE